MDPFSRRHAWGMLQGARQGRVMVLTTHFMDEVSTTPAVLARCTSLQCFGAFVPALRMCMTMAL